MQQLETKMVPVDSLVPYANNAKIHTDAPVSYTQLVGENVREVRFLALGKVMQETKEVEPCWTAKR